MCIREGMILRGKIEIPAHRYAGEPRFARKRPEYIQDVHLPSIIYPLIDEQAVQFT